MAVKPACDRTMFTLLSGHTDACLVQRHLCATLHTGVNQHAEGVVTCLRRSLADALGPCILDALLLVLVLLAALLAGCLAGPQQTKSATGVGSCLVYSLVC
eukprot:GHUV01051280.1.p1 GENE.GHUV01051280.1~~GHUV01051280.1.p1  ORF type:complete len:111 (-),score=12.53 GHUV01051280.1:201-503(-)